MIDARLGGLYQGLSKIIGKSIELQITDESKVQISDAIEGICLGVVGTLVTASGA